MKKNLPFYGITIGIFGILTFPSLFSDGMFMDGLIYAAVAKNLSNDIGSFWNLVFAGEAFRGHPPLAFGIQSFFFEIFGDSIFTERIYSLFTFVLSGAILVSIWKEITNGKYAHLPWLPLLFWLITPVVSWSCSNNMLENTITIFTTASVLFIVKGLKPLKPVYFFLAGLMLFAGFMTKGFTALFPWSLPLWIWMFQREFSFRQLISYNTLLIFGTILPIVLIYLFVPEGFKSLTAYFNEQVINSVKNVQTVDSRFWIIKKLFMELIPLIGISLLVKLFLRKRTVSQNALSKQVYVFTALGLSAVLPIMISLKQSGFYILAAFPFFAIVFALYLAPNIDHLVSRIFDSEKKRKSIKLAGLTLFTSDVTLEFFLFGHIGRDKEKLQDIYMLLEIIPHKSDLSISPDLRTDWGLNGYFERLANIKLDLKNKNDYFLVLKENEKLVPEGYDKISLDCKMYSLFKRN